MNALFAGAAFCLLARALFQTEGHYDPTAVAQVVAALGFALLAAFGGGLWQRRGVAKLDQWVRYSAPIWLLLIVEWQLNLLSIKRPGIYVRGDADVGLFNDGLLVAALVAATYLWPRMPGARWRLPVLVAIFCALGGWMIHAAPRPFIDVWYYEQHAADLLVHGQNPYTGEYPNIYGHTAFLGESILKNGNIQYHMYPPLSVLATLPGFLFGDARYSLVAATAGTALLIGATIRRLGRPGGDSAELAAVAVLFHARGFFLVEEAWTEPLIVLGAALTLYALTWTPPRRWPALTFFLSIKQYSIFWLPALLASRRIGWRTLGYAVAASALLALPFFIWGPDALFQGVVAFQFKQPFRWDALSVLAWWGRDEGVPLSPIYGFAAALLVMLVTVVRGLWIVKATEEKPLGLAETTLAGAATYLAFFAFNKQAFFNYYWFVGALLAMGMAVALAEVPAPIKAAKVVTGKSANARVVAGRRRGTPARAT